MNNEELFLKLYNELDDCLRSYYKDRNFSNSAIMRYIRDLNHSNIKLFQEYGKKLDMIRILRNDLIHEFDMNSSNIITINRETIDFLNKMIDVVKNPKTAKDIFTPINKLIYIKSNKLDTKISFVIDEMRQYGHSQLPIINGNNVLMGVFSPNVLFDFANKNKLDLNVLSIKDLLDFCDIKNHFSETYKFVSINTNLDDLSNLFLDANLNNEKLAMIFVTRSGLLDSPLEGVIVPKDIINALKL